MNMPAWLWFDGHLAWPLFALIVYTLLLFLITDFAWRIVVISIRQLVPIVVALWVIGAGALWMAG